MSDPPSIFVYDRAPAAAAFQGIAARALVRSMLAAVPPGSSWDCCIVYRGPNPLGGATAHPATREPVADELPLRSTDALEQHGTRILHVFEGGPEMSGSIATMRHRKWSAP
jgi:hypothetical protein